MVPAAADGVFKALVDAVKEQPLGQISHTLYDMGSAYRRYVPSPYVGRHCLPATGTRAVENPHR